MSEINERLARLSPEQRRQVLEEWQSRARVESTPALPRVTAPPLPRVAHAGGDFPLSSAQERLWFLDQISPGSSFYNISFARRVPFALDAVTLEQALADVVHRHSVLRTIYPLVNGELVQRVLPAGPARCVTTDLGSLASPERDAELQRRAAEAAQQPFDLSNGPVYRVSLIRLGPWESALLFVVHHIAADAASMHIVFRELGILYADRMARRPSSLGDLPVQYADFAVWQRTWLREDRLGSQLAYWQRQLANLETLNLPTDRPRPPVQTYRGAQLDVRIGHETRHGLYALAKKCAATPFMVLLTAFYVLLHRYAQQSDLSVGVPVANRPRRELEDVVGFFANSLVMRADLAGNPTFRGVLARVRETALQAYSNQDVPFSEVVAALRPRKDLSRNPLFQVSFQLLSQQPGSTGHVTGQGVAHERGSAIFDLLLNLWEAGDEVHGLFEYNTDLFDRDTAERMTRNYLTLLESIVANADAHIGSLALLTGAERHRMLVEWNATTLTYPDATVHAMVEEQVRRTPDAVAVQQGLHTLTYSELDSRASNLAQRVRQLRPQSRRAVGVLIQPSPDLLVALLGILKSGNAYVPLDPSMPPGRLAGMLDDATVELVVTSSELSDRVPCNRRALLVDANTCSDARLQEPTVETPFQRTSEIPADGSDLAYIIFTSGSTGRPKGVRVPHRGVVNYLNWCRDTYPVTDGIGAPLCSPPWSDMSVTTLFLPLICGTRVVLLDQGDIVDALDTALRAGPRFSFVKLTPSHLEALRTLSLGRDAPRNTAAFIVGGEALSGETFSIWRQQAPDLTIFNEYGPTETVVGCSVYRARAGELGTGPVPIGKPIANTRFYVLDQYGGPVPVGVPGELHIGGAGVALGYASAAQLTDSQFPKDVFAEGEARMYRTGDLVQYRQDGTLIFLGRLDGQIKIRGYRVEPADVDAAIRRHPGIKDSAIAIRDVGVADRRLVAYVVLRVLTDTGPIVQELRAFVQRELPPYMVPSAFNVVESIPMTTSGKVDLRALQTSTVQQPRSASPVLPVTALERVIAMVLEDVLDVAAISIDDDFFTDLGAHSLLATKAVARLRDLLRFEMPLRWIFETPTVRGLAETIKADRVHGPVAESVAGMVVAVFDMPEEEVQSRLSSQSFAEPPGRPAAGPR